MTRAWWRSSAPTLVVLLLLRSVHRERTLGADGDGRMQPMHQFMWRLHTNLFVPGFRFCSPYRVPRGVSFLRIVCAAAGYCRLLLGGPGQGLLCRCRPNTRKHKLLHNKSLPPFACIGIAYLGTESGAASHAHTAPDTTSVTYNIGLNGYLSQHRLIGLAHDFFASEPRHSGRGR